MSEQKSLWELSRRHQSIFFNFFRRKDNLKQSANLFLLCLSIVHCRARIKEVKEVNYYLFTFDEFVRQSLVPSLIHETQEDKKYYYFNICVVKRWNRAWFMRTCIVFILFSLIKLMSLSEYLHGVRAKSFVLYLSCKSWERDNYFCKLKFAKCR